MPAAHCAICLADVPAPPPRGDNTPLAYHPRCLRALFGTPTLPTLNLDTAEVLAAATQMAGKMSISGYQQKICMALTPGRDALVPAPAGGRFILKPQIVTPQVPENEHVTMRMARLVGVDIPPCGLVRLRDGAIAYIVARFDRMEDATKLHLEDFCQLAELPPADKYNQSADLCIRVLRQYATEPAIAVFNLYRYLVFSYSVANGDLHLKNLSLLRRPDGTRVLAPAYDLVNTQLAIGDQKFALMVAGADGPIRYSRWEQLATYARIPPKAATGIVSDQIKAIEPMVGLIRASFLLTESKEKYERILRDRVRLLPPTAGEASAEESELPPNP